MLGVIEAAYALPATTDTAERWSQRAGLDAAATRALIANGAGTYHHVTDETLVELGRRAISAVLERSGIEARRIDAMVLCHTSLCNVLPMPYTLSGELRAAAGLSKAWVFSITQQQCVSPLHALRALDALFARRRDWCFALLVCVDTILREELRAIGDAGIHSDGASAILVGRSAPMHVTAVATYNDPGAIDGILPDGRYAANDKYLWTLVSIIRRVLRAANVTPATLVRVLPHNVNLSAWRQALAALRIPGERLFADNFVRIGHVFGSDAAINIADAGVLHEPGPHLVFTSGLGGAFGGFVLRAVEGAHERAQ